MNKPPFKQYTVGQTIDNIKPGQYAIKVGGSTGRINDIYEYGSEPWYCDPADSIIKIISGRVPCFKYTEPHEEDSKFIIVNEEEYQMIKNNFKGVE